MIVELMKGVSYKSEDIVIRMWYIICTYCSATLGKVVNECLFVQCEYQYVYHTDSTDCEVS